MSSKETFQNLDPCMVAYSKLTLMLSLEKQSLPKSSSAQTVSPKQSFPYFTQCKATLCSFRFSQEAFFFFHSSWLIPPPPPSNLLHWPVCLWEKLAAPSSTIHYSPQASSVTLQCFRSPVASTPQQPKMLQYVSVSHSPTSKRSVSGCCMPVSSQNLANPGSSLSLSFSLCMWLCLLWLTRA